MKLLLGFLFIFASWGTAAGQAPEWWTDRGVIEGGRAPADFAPVNQGQLKNIATQAYQELLENLPGGTGDELQALISSWDSHSGTDFYTVNLGQLKNLARPFYDRLIIAGYTNAYPWEASSNSPADYALANIGQVKNLFRFDLMFDSDANGLPDWWELNFFADIGIDPDADIDGDGISNLEEYLDGTHPGDPFNYYNGQPPTIEIIAGNNQTIPPGAHTFESFQVLIRDGAPPGEPLSDAPVRFEEISGYSGLVFAPFHDAEGFSNLDLRTDADGMVRSPMASVFFRGSEVPDSEHSIEVTAGASRASLSVEISSAPASKLEAPRQVRRQDNGDGTITYTWTGSPSGADRFVVEEKNAAGSWITVVDLPISALSQYEGTDTYYTNIPTP